MSKKTIEHENKILTNSAMDLANSKKKCIKNLEKIHLELASKKMVQVNNKTWIYK